jgi:hypothetical protein
VKEPALILPGQASFREEKLWLKQKAPISVHNRYGSDNFVVVTDRLWKKQTIFGMCF